MVAYLFQVGLLYFLHIKREATQGNPAVGQGQVLGFWYDQNVGPVFLHLVIDLFSQGFHQADKGHHRSDADQEAHQDKQGLGLPAHQVSKSNGS